MVNAMNHSFLRIGFAIEPGDPFWVQVREAVGQRADALGLSLIPIQVPARGAGGEAHLHFLEELKAQEIQALISHVLPESLMRAILASGLPLICSEDTSLGHPLLVSVHGLGRAAVMAAEYLVDRIEGEGQILMVGGRTDPALTATLRIEGFLGVIRAYPGLRCCHVGDGWRYDETLDQLLEEAEVWTPGLERPIRAIFGLSDSLALAGRDACRKLALLDTRTVIVGINGDPLALAAIQAGTMDATIATSPQDLGYRLADFARQAALQEPLPHHFPYSFELVTAANLSQVAVEKLVFIADLPSRLVDVNRQQEQQRLLQLQTSLEINQRLGSILDPDELLAAMAQIFRSRYGFDRADFYLWSNPDRTFTLLARSGKTADPVPLATSGPLGHALLNNRLIYIPDTGSSPRYPPDLHWPDTRTRVILPVRVGGQALGVLDLHSQIRRLCNQAELDALQTLADEMGIGMRNGQLYAQALQARAEAVQASLLRSRLLARVSQQFRAPLNVILGYCQAALANPTLYGLPLPDELLRDLRHIEGSGAALQRLVNDLLELAQAETGTLRLHPEEVALQPFLKEVFESARRVMGEGGTVRWRLQVPASLPTLLVDPIRLRTMLMNLLDNAARFTERGQILLGADYSESWVHLWVQDTGCGMTPETLTLVRQRALYGVGELPPRADGNPEGAGLGLAVVQYLAALHRGEFRIESDPGRGTTCHLFLPRHAGPAHPEERAADPVAGTGIRQRQPRLSQQLVDKVQEFVARNYATAFTREEIAAAVGVTPTYVSRVFRQQTGMALWDYVNGYRVARARELLEHSDLTVTEIAFTVGFNDSSYFSRVFRKETGLSPAAYRASRAIPAVAAPGW